MTRLEQTDQFWADDLSELKGPWLGQIPPGDDPVEFAPNIFSTGRHTFCTAFTSEGDELLFATADLGKDIAHLAWTRMQADGSWSQPVAAPFNSAWNDNDICLSPDGTRALWRSWRPLPGNSLPEERSALWAADRLGDGWTDAYPISCDGEIVYGGYPGIARSGAIYFAGRKSPEECCVYRAERSGSMYGAAQPIICGMQYGGDLCISPDERFLVIACWRIPSNRGEGDLYISIRAKDGRWLPLRNLGDPISTERIENCPMFSPDGRRFFFFRYQRTTKEARTYWVSASRLSRS